MNMDTPLGNSGFGSSTSSDFGTGTSTTKSSDICPHCGQSTNRGLEQFLGQLGISDEMIENLKSSVQNIHVEEYLNTAREYLKTGSNKATTYAKENPGKVAAGVAALAVGTGILISALNRDR